MLTSARRAVAILAALSVSGCATARVVIPANPEAAYSSVGGVGVYVSGAPWEAEPEDLTDYLTPIAVELVNDSAYEVRVAYADFALTDSRGFRYAAINPFSAAEGTGRRDGGAPESARLAIVADRPDALRDGVLIAGRFSMPAPRPGGARVFVPPVARRFGGGMPGFRIPAPRSVTPWHHRYGQWSGGWRGYAPLPQYRRWYGPTFNYWAGPAVLGLGIGAHVWAWSALNNTRYVNTPPDDVVRAGLPEGVLAPGGRASGFLYFQRVHDDEQQLALTWNATEAKQSAPLGQARVDVIVVRE